MENIELQINLNKYFKKNKKVKGIYYHLLYMCKIILEIPSEIDLSLLISWICQAYFPY